MLVINLDFHTYQIPVSFDDGILMYFGVYMLKRKWVFINSEILSDKSLKCPIIVRINKQNR